MKKLKFTKILILLLLPLSVAFPQSKGLLEKARKIFDKSNNFEALFVYKNSGRKGKIIFSKKYGDKLTLGDYEILVKDDTVFNFNSKTNRFVISPKDDEYSDFSLKNVLYDLPARCEISEQNRTVTLVPENPDAENFSRIEITFDNDNLPEKILFYATDGTKSIFEIQSIRFNKKFTEKDFLLHTNEKTKIIDFR